ncbi:hypothetical protein ACSLBF_13130 [Pseudoalteromonas sp. T1lg65]|uniref:hypothetical protein n=1 Tax=Pseudoalteromonas sp. T1lg65 TaxID=2077101 RepID=UPI003F7AEDC1
MKNLTIKKKKLKQLSEKTQILSLEQTHQVGGASLGDVFDFGYEVGKKLHDWLCDEHEK